MANPIAFLLGAGASLPFGVPMMAGFYASFREYVARRHPHCFAFLERLEENGARATHDLETLLSDLNVVLGLERGSTLLGFEGASLQRDVELARELRGYLDAFIVDTCERFDHAAAVQELQPLVALREVGPLWIFTTNYDRIIEYACEQCAVPWTDGFEYPGGQAVADWTGIFATDVRIVKLHGSVNWYVDDPGGSLHRLDRGYSLPGYDFKLVRRDQRLRPLMIIPTLEKEALGTPYVELSVRFTDALRESRLLIIAGNSLRDRHIRDYIQTRMGTLYVLLVSPSATQRRSSLGFLDRVAAIDAGFSEFLAVGGGKLVELARTLEAVSPADAGNTAAIEAFVATVSQDALDETALREDSDLRRLLAGSRAPFTTDRVQAVRELASHPHPAVTRRLERLLTEDPDVHVRIACISVLLQVADEDAIPVIADALRLELSTSAQLELVLALLRFPQNNQSRDALRQALARAELSSVARGVIEARTALWSS